MRHKESSTYVYINETQNIALGTYYPSCARSFLAYAHGGAFPSKGVGTTAGESAGRNTTKSQHATHASHAQWQRAWVALPVLHEEREQKPPLPDFWAQLAGCFAPTPQNNTMRPERTSPP